MLLVTINCYSSPSIIYRYNSTTGTFTVPTGGDGYYYFSVYFTLKGRHNGVFQLNINEQNICTVIVYTLQTDDFGQSSCGGVIYAEEGKVLQHPLSKLSNLIKSGQNRTYVEGKNWIFSNVAGNFDIHI